MLYPSIDSLMEKLDSKYILVTVSSKRARELQQKSLIQIAKPKSTKYVGMALEEINGGKLRYSSMPVED
jgi:DNA-directed RNA polymerase subunit omega